MSSVGYPDYQRITQWLGPPLLQGTGVVIGAGTHVDGPVEAANFASVIVAVKPTTGNVTVTIKQTIPGGPASLVLTETVIVPAGATLFEAFVLFGSAVELDLTGSIAGTSVDYALYGSNTTTNAQVITSATINIQKADVLVAAEPTLDFLESANILLAIVDDAPGTRVKITPSLNLPLILTGADAGPLAQVRLVNTVAGKTFDWYLGNDGIARAEFFGILGNIIQVDSAGGVQVNSKRVMRHPYATDQHSESGTFAYAAGTVNTSITFTSAFAATPAVVGACNGPDGTKIYTVSPSTSGATLTTTNAPAGGVAYWIAMGQG